MALKIWNAFRCPGVSCASHGSLGMVIRCAFVAKTSEKVLIDDSHMGLVVPSDTHPDLCEPKSSSSKGVYIRRVESGVEMYIYSLPTSLRSLLQ